MFQKSVNTIRTQQATPTTPQTNVIKKLQFTSTSVPKAYSSTGLYAASQGSDHCRHIAKPCKEIECWACGGLGHLQSECPNVVNNLKKVVEYSEEELEKEEDTTNKGKDLNYAPITNPTHKPSITTQETATLPTTISALPTTKPDSDNSRKLLVVRGKMLGKSVWVLINGGSQGDFTSSQLVRVVRASTIPRDRSMFLRLADGNKFSMCNYVLPAILKVESKSETMHLDVAPIGYNVILGKPWLTKHNLAIN